MSEVVHRCALQDVDPTGGEPTLRGEGVLVTALPLFGHVLIQLPPGAGGGTLPATTGLALPAAPNRATAGEPAVMWLSPRAWVVIGGPVSEGTRLAARIAETLRPHGGHAVDLADAHQSIRVEGPAAAFLLGQGCALDLDPVRFDVGSATRTSIARIPSILHRSSGQAFVVHVDRSLAGHLWEWLGHGIREITALAAVSGAPVA